MSRILGIVGESGSGKSTSLETLNPEETFIINCSRKPLPFKGWKSKYKMFSKEKGSNDDNGGNHYMTENAKVIISLLEHIDKNREDVNKIIIDDAQYIMSTEYMNRADEGGWDKFTDIAKNIWSVINKARSLSRDIDVIITFHSEDITDGGQIKRKIKTIGKMIDNTITLEGLFTIILYTHVKIDLDSGEPQFHFQTKTDGRNTCKTPKGMFEELLIPNDMQYVFDKIKQYEQ
jgi:hypothetical protein